MNLDHAQFFADRYNDMIETITANLPRNERLNLRGIEIHSNGAVQVNYETYIGCGDYEPDVTYYQLSDFFSEHCPDHQVMPGCTEDQSTSGTSSDQPVVSGA